MGSASSFAPFKSADNKKGFETIEIDVQHASVVRVLAPFTMALGHADWMQLLICVLRWRSASCKTFRWLKP